MATQLNPLSAGFGDLLQVYLNALGGQTQDLESAFDTRIGEYQRGAEGALGGYRTAAAAPLAPARPDVGPLQAGAAMLGGNLAHAAAPWAVQGPSAGETLEGQKKLNRADILQKRESNLAVLLKRYEDQAEGARRMGDVKMEIMARSKIEQLGKSFEALKESIREAGEVERERVRQAGMSGREGQRTPTMYMAPTRPTGPHRGVSLPVKYGSTADKNFIVTGFADSVTVARPAKATLIKDLVEAYGAIQSRNDLDGFNALEDRDVPEEVGLDPRITNARRRAYQRVYHKKAPW